MYQISGDGMLAMFVFLVSVFLFIIQYFVLYLQSFTTIITIIQLVTRHHRNSPSIKLQMKAINKLKSKLHISSHDTEHAQHQSSGNSGGDTHGHDGKPIGPSIDVPLAPTDPYHTTALVTHDPLDEVRYKEGLTTDLRARPVPSNSSNPSTQYHSQTGLQGTGGIEPEPLQVPGMEWAYRTPPTTNTSTSTNASAVPGLIGGIESLVVSGHDSVLEHSMGGTNPVLKIKCGPLLRFKTIDFQNQRDHYQGQQAYGGQQQEQGQGPMWQGSAMIVTIDDGSLYAPTLPTLTYWTTVQASTYHPAQHITGLKLHQVFGCTFWRFDINVPLINDFEQKVTYTINSGRQIDFFVPSALETMRIMFHSCNGFSLSVDQTKFCGPDPLWRDVLRAHSAAPFHVMCGGGDQIYCDLVTKRAALFKDWLSMSALEHKTKKEFTPEMRTELEMFYFEHYAWWFRQGQFGIANARIPMVNIWDDHDIIDGFGSYPDHFMRSPVFSGLGNVAFLYYLLFQQQSVPNEPENSSKHWIYGSERGPYIHEFSRNTLSWLGPKVALLGFDNRTERRREQVNYEATYARIFDRLERAIVGGETQHLIVLLGIPIAYPRLVWLEELLTSKLMDPIKLLGKTGVLSGFTNNFDSGVEILDDLDDHWTAKHHKKERNEFVHRLQDLALSKSVRITILGGDVHLAAIGEFYTPASSHHHHHTASSNTVSSSQPHATISGPGKGGNRIEPTQDHRYIPNIISSAIVNTPPAETVSNILGKRNKIHHLDPECDEIMAPVFERDVNGRKLNNTCLLPRRNWCGIAQRAMRPASQPDHTGQGGQGGQGGGMHRTENGNLSQPHGDSHPGSSPSTRPPPGSSIPKRIEQGGELEVVLRVEIDQSNPDGNTVGYTYVVPTLQLF